MKYEKNFIEWRGEKFPTIVVHFSDDERSEQFPLSSITVADIELFFAIEHDMNAQCKEAENIDHGIFYYMDSGTVAAVHEGKIPFSEMFRTLKRSIS